MSQHPRWAPGTLPYMIDIILWRTYRIAAVIALFGTVGVAFIGRSRTGIWITIISFFIWLIAWGGRRLMHQYWRD